MITERPVRTPEEEAAVRNADRRQFWIIAVVFVVGFLIASLIYTAIDNWIQPPSPVTGAGQQIDEPGMPIPDGGAKPTSPGDRGGSEQLALMTGLIVVLSGGTAWVYFSSRRAKRRLAVDDELEAITSS